MNHPIQDDHLEGPGQPDITSVVNQANKAYLKDHKAGPLYKKLDLCVNPYNI
jgi:hypothetical protein